MPGGVGGGRGGGWGGGGSYLNPYHLHNSPGD